MTHHDTWMQQAIRTARHVWGQTAENPAVGCVLVKDGQVLAAASTAPGGRPHAETEALRQAGEAASGATAYVTLEPCAHHGHTPPCAEALIAAGVARVVIACTDPDARVNGKGIALLRQAGIEVETGVCEAEAAELYYGFFLRQTEGVPEINVKIATSADGKITYADGSSKWITGEDARQYGHQLRAEHDAILTGIGTVLADDPELTCRLPGLEDASPQPVVLDRQLRMPPEAKLVRPGIRIYTEQQDVPEALQERGVEVITLPEVTIEAVASDLATRGINRLMVEAGQAVTSHVILSGWLHHLYWFRAGMTIGEEGTPAFSDAAYEQVRGYRLQTTQTLGKDVLDVYAAPKTGKREIL